MLDSYLQIIFRAAGLRLDANESAALAKQLEHVKAQTYDVLRSPRKVRQFVPVDTSVPAGAETITYRAWDEVGAAEVIANYADDLSLADAHAIELTAKVKSLGKAYQWSIQDLRRSEMAGMQLDARRGRAAANAMENAVERIGAKGDAATGLLGCLNNPNVPTAAAAFAIEQATSVDNILAVLNDAAQAVVDQSAEVHIPDTMILPSAAYGHIASRRVDATNNKTILQAFLETNPYIRNVDQWIQCNDAGAGATTRMWVYTRSPDMLTLDIPQEFEQLPPQARNLAFVVPCHMRIAGVRYYYPLSAVYRDGV